MTRRFEERKCRQMAREYGQAIYTVTKSFPKETLFLQHSSFIIPKEV